MEEGLLSEVRSLSALERAKVGAILGSLVADAAYQPIHWIYNPAALEKAISANPEAPEFLPVSANPYYCISTGNQSPYGDELLTILESLVECKGFDAKDVAERMFRDFGPDSAYGTSASNQYNKKMQDKSMYPIQGKWQGYQIRRFCKCYSEGTTVESLKEADTNVDPDCIARNVALIALLAGKPQLLNTLQESSLLTQTNDMMLAIVGCSARIIERYILNGASDGPLHPIEQVMQDLRDPKRLCPDDLDLAMATHLKEVVERRHLSVKDASMKFGVSCDMPGSVQSTLHSLLGGWDYVTTVRKVALAGGCNCSRVSMVGACLGAKFGVEGIPLEWVEKTDAAPRALSLALKLVKL